jgi:hypothetical protein
MRTEPLCGYCVAVVASTLAGGTRCEGAGGDRTADRIAGLVAQLGDDQFARREAAERTLAAIARPALPALRKAATDGDAEVRARAERLVATITRGLAEAELAGWGGSWTGPNGSTLTITGDRLVAAAPGDGSVCGRLVVVEVGETCVQADLRIEEDGEEAGTARAIFRLDADTLHYCGNDPGQPRPAEFKSQGTNYYVPWKRAKKQLAEPGADADPRPPIVD